MNSIPVFFLLSFAESIVIDADVKCYSKSFDIADAWMQQAQGIHRAVMNYMNNGGDMTTHEVSAHERLVKLIDMVSKRIPPREDWPTADKPETYPTNRDE